MPVPLLDLKLQFKEIEQDIRSAIEGVLKSQYFIMGRTVKEFEDAVTEYCNVKHAIGCASGSDALLLALMALDVGPGDEVITAPFSFYSSTGSIVRLGAKPVFADIDPLTFNVAPESIEQCITSQTKAIMPVHLFGQVADMDGILRIAEKFGLAVIEDAAQTIGAKYDGKKAGCIGDVGCFSCFPSKNLGAYGDAGFITTDNDDLADRLRVLRVHGEKEKYVHYEVGINSRLDALQAAILHTKLPYLDRWSDKRKANAEEYNRLFVESGLAPKYVKTPYSTENINPKHRHVYNQYTLRVQDRDGLAAHLARAEIGHAVYYPVVLYLQPCFEYLGLKSGLCPEAEKAANEVISLPIYPELTVEQKKTVVEVIKEFYL